MTAAALLEKLLVLRIKHGEQFASMTVLVATGPDDAAHEVSTEAVEVRHVLGENVLYIGRSPG